MAGVVMLVNEFPPLPVGGAETQAERLSTYLAHHGWNVWVVTRRGDGLPENEERNGFQIVRPLTTGSGKIRTITFMFFAMMTLFRMRNQYQILHAHLAFGPAFIGVLIGRLLGKKVIVKLGGSNAIGDIQVSMSTWRGRLRLWAIRRWAHKVIALTDVMRDEALQAGVPAERVRIMNNGIDGASYLSSQKEREDAKHSLNLVDKSVALFIGRLDPVKSLSTTIDAIHIAKDKHPSIHFVIVGDGPEREKLEAQVQNLDVQANISFAGNQKNVRPYLQAADMFLLPSITEGISNALLEAMASGLPCLATPVGGNNEVLEHGKYGLMVPVANVSEWADALVRMATTESLRKELGTKAHERVLSMYDFNVVGSQYEKLYSELMSEVSR